MSAADAGRKKIESRTAEFVKVGDRILDPNGREYLVKGLSPSSGGVTLDLQPVGQCGQRSLTFDPKEEVRVRR